MERPLGSVFSMQRERVEEADCNDGGRGLRKLGKARKQTVPREFLGKERRPAAT